MDIGIRVFTTACYWHDYCVCAYSWGDCLWFDASNPPNGSTGPCLNCVNLIDAVISLFGEFYDMLVQWFNDTFGGEVPNVQLQ